MLNPSFSLAGAGLLGAAFLGAFAIIKIQGARIDALKADLSAERATIADLQTRALENAAELGAANGRLQQSLALTAERQERQLNSALAAIERTQSLEGGIDELQTTLAGMQCATGASVADGLRVNQRERNNALRSRQAADQ